MSAPDLPPGPAEGEVMSDSLVRLMVLLLRPVEVWWSWRWQRAYRAGKFSRPAEWSPVQGSPCVTTKRAA